SRRADFTEARSSASPTTSRSVCPSSSARNAPRTTAWSSARRTEIGSSTWGPWLISCRVNAELPAGRRVADSPHPTLLRRPDGAGAEPDEDGPHPVSQAAKERVMDEIAGNGNGAAGAERPKLKRSMG